MKKTERFADLAAVRAEKQRLAAVCDRHAGRLQRHYAVLKQKEFRTAVAREAMGGLLRHAVPQGLSALVGGGGLASGLQLAMGTKGGWAKRAGLLAAGLLAPSLLHRMEQFSLEDLGRELKVSVGRLKEYLEKHRTGRQTDPGQDET